MSDIAIDDVSLSPECFGLNIPESELSGYNYWNPIEEPPKEVHKDFLNQTGKSKIFGLSAGLKNIVLLRLLLNTSFIHHYLFYNYTDNYSLCFHTTALYYFSLSPYVAFRSSF